MVCSQFRTQYSVVRDPVWFLPRLPGNLRQLLEQMRFIGWSFRTMDTSLLTFFHQPMALWCVIGLSATVCCRDQHKCWVTRKDVTECTTECKAAQWGEWGTSFCWQKSDRNHFLYWIYQENILLDKIILFKLISSEVNFIFKRNISTKP